MEKIKYTDKEIKYIKKTEKEFLNELFLLMDESSLKKISINLEIITNVNKKDRIVNTWQFTITDTAVKVRGEWSTSPALVTIGERHLFGIKVNSELRTQDLLFVRNFSNIKKKVITEEEKARYEKENVLRDIEDNYNRQKGNVLIDLQDPNNTNLTTIEVEEKDGRKIGTIDFGSHIIQIITDGNIELVKREDVKQKIK